MNWFKRKIKVKSQFQPGVFVRHKLTSEKMLLVSHNWIYNPVTFSLLGEAQYIPDGWKVRRKDLSIINLYESELEIFEEDN